MKKGKVLATLSMLILTIACLTFGVFAIISTSFTANGTITFNAYNLDIDVEIYAIGTSEFTTLYYSTTPSRDKHSTNDKTWQTINGSTTVSGLSLDFDELSGNTNFDTQLKMKITNYSDYAIKATATATAVSGIDTSVENVAYIYKNVTETMASGQTAPEAHSDTVVVHFTPTSSSTAASGAFNINVAIEPSEYQEDDASTYVMDTRTKTQINGYTGTKDYLVIPRVVNGYNVKSVIMGDYLSSYYNSSTDTLNVYIDGEISRYGSELYSWWDNIVDYENNIFSYEFQVDDIVISGILDESFEYETSSNFQCSDTVKTLIISEDLQLPDGAFSGFNVIGATKRGYAGYWEQLSEEPSGFPTYLWEIPESELNFNYDQYAEYAGDVVVTWNCFNTLERFIIANTKPEDTAINVSAFERCSDAVIQDINGVMYLMNNSIPYAVYKVSDTSIPSCEIEPTTKIIMDHAFEDCTSLTSITIPSSVTSIGEDSFYGCTQLTGQSIGSETNVKYLGYTDDGGNFVPTVVYKVTNKTALSGAYSIPNTCKVIYDEAFYRCSSLNSITIPNSVTSIGKFAFNGCTSLSSITIPSSVTSIGSYAFYNCSALNTVYIDSATIATSLTSKTARGYIINNLKSSTGKLYIKSDIAESSIGSYVKDAANFTKEASTVTANDVTYNVYTKV